MALTKSVNVEVMDAKVGFTVAKVRRTVGKDGLETVHISGDGNWSGFTLQLEEAREFHEALGKVLGKEVLP